VSHEQGPLCGICGAAKLAAIFAEPLAGGRRLYGCGACGAQVLLPLPTAEELRGIYGPEYYRAWGMAERETREAAEMKRRTFGWRMDELERFVSGGRILDVGTASGFLLEVARERGFEPFGVELSEYAAGIAKGKFGEERIWNGTLETAPFERGSFAAVTMCDLLEHVTDPVATLAAAGGFLRPGGVILVMTPNTGSISRRVMGRRWAHYKAEHLFYINRGAMEHLARKTGMELAWFGAARKCLTLRYVHTQLQTYRHAILTPLVGGLYALGFFARDWHIPVVIGEFTAILRKPD
jgi:2-polyprenyl-3-methyl-5-hydroxy-6-metoxy-1,4-benzoquinol methylase